MPEEPTRYESVRNRLLERATEGAHVVFPDGWCNILDSLDRALAEIDADYRVRQVKDKFGSLRFYFTASPTAPQAARWAMEELVRATEFATYSMCTDCGFLGERYRSEDGHYDVMCTTHVRPGYTVLTPVAVAVQAEFRDGQ